MRPARCARGTSSGSRSTPPCSLRPSRFRPTPSCCMPRFRGSIASPAGTEYDCDSPICASQAGRDDGGALRPRQAVQPASPPVAPPAHSARTDHQQYVLPTGRCWHPRHATSLFREQRRSIPSCAATWSTRWPGPGSAAFRRIRDAAPAISLRATNAKTSAATTPRSRTGCIRWAS